MPREALNLVRMVSEPGLAGIEVVKYSPPYDWAEQTALLSSRGQVRSVAIAEDDPERAARWRNVFPFPLDRGYIHGAAILDCRVVDIADVLQAGGEFEAGKRNLAPAGYRAMTVVPMVREGVALGAIAVVRVEPGPLSAEQIALLEPSPTRR